MYKEYLMVEKYFSHINTCKIKKWKINIDRFATKLNFGGTVIVRFDHDTFKFNVKKSQEYQSFVFYFENV